SKFKIGFEERTNEVIRVFKKYFLVVDCIVVYFPVFSKCKSNLAAPFHFFVKIKPVIVHRYLLCVSAHEPDVQFIIVAGNVVIHEFQSIVYPAKTGVVLNQPLIKISVNYFEIRYWEYVPSFLHINLDVYI